MLLSGPRKRFDVGCILPCVHRRPLVERVFGEDGAELGPAVEGEGPHGRRNLRHGSSHHGSSPCEGAMPLWVSSWDGSSGTPTPPTGLNTRLSRRQRHTRGRRVRPVAPTWRRPADPAWRPSLECAIRICMRSRSPRSPPPCPVASPSQTGLGRNAYRP